MDREFPWAKALRGLALVQIGRALEALPYFEEVLSGSPGLVVARLGRAMANFAAGRHQDAVADATEVIRVEPDNADALTIRGDCYLALADFAAAASDFQRAMSIAGRTPALGLRYLSAVLQQRRLGAQPDAKIDPGNADPDEGSSRGPLLDWLSRKIRPRSGGHGGQP